VEDTDGAPLDYQRKMMEFDPSKFPLYEVAVKMGVAVNTGITTDCYGFFSPDTNSITLGTSDVTTFMHELSHAVDNALPGKSEDRNFCEVVAELSSCFLCSLYGLPHHEEHTKAYIADYQGKSPVAFQIAKAIDRVLEIYNHIQTYTSEQKEAQ
jgi:antirestriction protein ArdC